jgi:hypothetical protein
LNELFYILLEMYGVYSWQSLVKVCSTAYSLIVVITLGQ